MKEFEKQEPKEFHIYEISYSKNNIMFSFQFNNKKNAEVLFDNLEKLSLSKKYARINNCKKKILFSFVPGGTIMLRHIKDNRTSIPEYDTLDLIKINQINLKNFL